MTAKTKKILDIMAFMVIVLVLITAAYYAGHRRTVKLQQRISDLEVQLAHATIPMKTDTIRDSIPVVTQLIVEIDKTDYKQQAADRQLIKDLELQISQIKAENTMLRETIGKVKLKPVRPAADSLPTAPDTLFAYHDQWVDFRLNTQDHTLDYVMRDSLKTYIDRIPKRKFLWWRWGTKGYRVKHVNFNPHSKIIYSQTILIK